MHPGRIQLHNRVKQGGYPNAWRAKVPVRSNWNVDLFQVLLQGYEDAEVVEWIRYSWPISRPPNVPDPTPIYVNHQSANKYTEQMIKYLNKEISHGAVVGPWKEVPFKSRIVVLPLSTREKKDSTERRVLMDLSWPVGMSVNDGIGKDQFMGFWCKLTFPTVDAIAKRVSEVGTHAKLYKIDLSRYFRQLPIDPYDYSLLCFTFLGNVFFDVMAPMGLCSAPMFAQCTSNALRYIPNSLGYFLFNYIDDFIGVESVNKVWDSYNTFHRTLRDLGVREAESKQVAPTHELNCVGTLVNAKNMTVSVLPERKVQLHRELLQWLNYDEVTPKQVQSLVRKLQFICACVRPGRVFISRMLNFLRQMKGKNMKVSNDFKKDVLWWVKYLPEFTGTGILWMLHIKEPDEEVASDACLVGMGTVSGKEYVKLTFPKDWK